MEKENLIIMIFSNTFEEMEKLLEMMGNRECIIKGYLYHSEYLMDIEEVKPDLILLDLPRADIGIEVIEKIKQHNELSEIPIVVGIENEAIDSLSWYKKIGVKDYVLKPYRVSELTWAIDNAVQYIELQAHLKGKQIQFDALFNNAPYMTWFKDKNSYYVTANNEFQEHCGKTLDKIQGMKDEFVWNGKIGDKCRNFDAKVMEKRKQIVFDEVIPGEKGYREFNIYKSPVVDEQNNITGTLGIARDITELKNKETKMNIIIENMPLGICLKDTEGVILNINTQFKDLFGIKDQDVVGRKFEEMIEKDYYEIMERADQQALQERKSIIFEYKVQTHKGEKIIEVHKAPVIDISNEAIGIVGLFRDVTEIKKTEEKVKKLVYTDWLTGVSNRRGLYNYFEEEISGKDIDFAVMFIDLDNFKLLNDNCGHYWGDEALIFIAQKLVEIFEGAFVARMGGDEFVVVWKGVSNQQVLKDKAEDIRNFMATEFNEHDKFNIVSASIGIVSGNSRESDIDSLLGKGDIALYKAKESGKNKYVFYSQGLDEELIFRMQIEKDLKKAVINNEVVLYYQPQYTTNGKLKGFEALFRWKNEKYRDIPIIDIIKITEKNNIIDLIGDYIIKESLKFAKKINQISKSRLIVSINISAVQIMNSGFVQRMKQLIEEIGVSPQNIGIEITETVLLEDIERSIEKIRELKKFGLTISLDDFGTGYSSFNYLVKLPLSLVKIDQSFIRGMKEGQEYITLVRLMIDAAHSLNLPVIAEGVETKRELEILKTMGIDYIQGYLFSRPLPECEVEKLITK